MGKKKGRIQSPRSSDCATLPFEQDALLAQQPLRSTYVFYPNDVQRDFSRQDLRPNIQKNESEENEDEIEEVASKIMIESNEQSAEIKKDQITQPEKGINVEDEYEDETMNETLMMMNRLSFDEDEEKKTNVSNHYFRFNANKQLIEEKENEIDSVIKFLRKFPDYPGIVVNVARKI